jgi:hypothetical protein
MARALTPIPDSSLTSDQQANLGHTFESNPDRPGCCALCGEKPAAEAHRAA